MTPPVPPRIVRVVVGYEASLLNGLLWGSEYWEVWVAGAKVCHAYSEAAAVQAVADFQEVL